MIIGWVLSFCFQIIFVHSTLFLKVHISKFEIKRKDPTKLDFLIHCKKGTYIRSLAHDFGKKLNSGAHLSSLRRIKNGSQSIENAYSMESVIDQNSKKNIKSIKSVL